jgi:hypothetical protein
MGTAQGLLFSNDPAHGRRFPPPWSVEEQGACFIVRELKTQKRDTYFFRLDDRVGDKGARRAVACACPTNDLSCFINTLHSA